MSTCSRKINELKERLDGISGLSDQYIFKKLIQISLIISDIEKYADEDSLNGTCYKNTELGELIKGGKQSDDR